MRAPLATLSLAVVAACVEPGPAVEWPEPESSVRLLFQVNSAGTVQSSVVRDGDLRVLSEGTDVYLLSLRDEELLAVHPRLDRARLHELRAEPGDPVCTSGYDVERDRVYAPIPQSALWHELEGAGWSPRSPERLPALLTQVRLTAPLSEDRGAPPGRVRPYGAERRVTADGWLASGKPRFLASDAEEDAFHHHHRIHDAQALDRDHVLVLQPSRMFVFRRGAAPLTTDEGLVELHWTDLPDLGRSEWSFASFAVLPGRSAAGAWRVILSSSTGEGVERLSRVTWLEVTHDPPSFLEVHSATVAGGSSSFAATVDVHGRALLVFELAREATARLHERRAAVVVGPAPPLRRFLPESSEVLAFLAPSPLPERPHLVVLDDGRVRLGDLLRPEVQPIVSRLPQFPGGGVSAMGADLDALGRLRMAVGGERGELLLFDPEEERWSEPRFVAADETRRAPGCVAASAGDACGLHQLGVELRDILLHTDPSGRRWTLAIPRHCPQVLAAGDDRFIAGFAVTPEASSMRALARMRTGFGPRHRLLSTPTGELYELELD